MLGACAIGGLLMAGCGSITNALPETTEVLLPDGTQATAARGEGPKELAGKQLSLRAIAPSAGQSANFLRLVMNSRGGISSFEDNTIAPEIFGTRIILDGRQHPTLQPGLSYSGAVYGAVSTDGKTFTFQARIQAFAAGLLAATAEANVQAEFIDAETVGGVFEYKTQVTLADIPNGDQAGTIEFTAAVGAPEESEDEVKE
jgi:hypothetical protein